MLVFVVVLAIFIARQLKGMVRTHDQSQEVTGFDAAWTAYTCPAA